MFDPLRRGGELGQDGADSLWLGLIRRQQVLQEERRKLRTASKTGFRVDRAGLPPCGLFGGAACGCNSVIVPGLGSGLLVTFVSVDVAGFIIVFAFAQLHGGPEKVQRACLRIISSGGRCPDSRYATTPGP